MNLRFSLRALLAGLTFCAVSCAALTSAGELWHSIVVTITVGVLLALCVVAVNDPGKKRSAAGGALLCGGGYLLLAFGPWFSTHTAPWLLTTKLLVQAETMRKPGQPATSGALAAWIGDVSTGVPIASTTNVWATSSVGPVVINPNAPSISTFVSIGHWLFAWIAAAIGARFALAVRRPNEAVKRE